MATRNRPPKKEEASTVKIVDEGETIKALQLVVLTDTAIKTYRLPEEGRATIGRSPTNDICIDHPSVSRRHAVLHIGPPFRVEDLGGANGTNVRRPRKPGEGGDSGGIKLEKAAVEIDVGDSITFGAVMVVLHRAAGQKADLRAAESPPDGPLAERGIIVRDPALAAIYEQAFRAAAGSISVLLLGETGVGKEVLAKAIHDASPRAQRPFLGLNCAALSESLLESELFGYEKGAFTGAATTRVGLFESADGGTIFLDEVGELPMSIQVKLLRVLELREVLRVGGRAPHRINVRFVCATNRDPEAEVARGTFRQDLFFRLNGITLTIPPLRDRPLDIAPLAQMFAKSACEQLGRASVPPLSAEALAAMKLYRWPGNIRELRNVIERAVVLCMGDTLELSQMPAAIAAAAEEAIDEGRGEERDERDERKTQEPTAPIVAEVTASEGATSEGAMRQSAMSDGAASQSAMSEGAMSERDRIVKALERCAGNQTRAAELLGISRRTLVSRIKHYDLPRPLKAR